MAPPINAFGQNVNSPFGGSSSISGQSSSSSSGPFTFGGSVAGASSSFASTSTCVFAPPSFSAFQAPLPFFAGSGQTSAVLFGSSAPSAFGSHSNNGQTVSIPFDSTMSFGSTNTGSPFGQNSFGPFGTASTSSSLPCMSGSRMTTHLPFSAPTFGASATPFSGSGQTSAVLSGSSAPSAFGSHSNNGGTVCMPFGSTVSFGATTTGSPFGQNSSGLFGAAPTSSCSPFMSGSRKTTRLPFSTPCFGVPTTPFSGFGESGVSNQRKASQAAPHVTTAVNEDIPRQCISVSAMPAYEDKSHEELRWDYYQSENKGQNF